MEHQSLAGRLYPEVYRVTGRQDLFEFIAEAIESAGGRLIYMSDPGLAPMYFGVQLDTDERLGLLVYPFRVTRRVTRNRPSDEFRGQLRYGSESSWGREHPIGRDIADVDVTLILGVDPEERVFVGLDASIWDPLPMGISFYAKSEQIQQAKDTGWFVWEKENRGGSRRSDPRSPTSLETIVVFTPNRILDFARLERRATSLRLDPALRFAAAVSLGKGSEVEASAKAHTLESQFDLSSEEILDIIVGRTRLSVAVRGGVAEHHLETHLSTTDGVAAVARLDIDAMHDFDVTLDDGRSLSVECKNASPHRYANGDFKVEVQKTRASKGDPASRFYPVDGFEVVAACLFSATGKWEFRFAKTDSLRRHERFPDRLAPMQAVTTGWVRDITELGA